VEPEEFLVAKYTVQLYFHPAGKPFGENVPVQIASGILIRKYRKYFLLTCKHVFNGINISDVIILTRSLFAVRLPDEIKFINNDTDSIDLALVELKSHRLTMLKSYYSFLPYRNLGFKHIFDEDLYYMFFGFINKRTELKDYALEAESFGYLTNIRHYRKFEELGFNYRENVSLEYNRRKVGDFNDDTRVMMGPKELKGMSGGGIWLSVADRKRDTYRYLLVGIMIEERLDQGFIIGTKIGLIQNHLNVHTEPI
jgi:hypothetical protein